MRIGLLVLAAVVGATPRPGDLVVTEIAANPALAEPAGEFVVVDNVGAASLSIDGVRLTDGQRAVRGVVPAGTSLDPGQRIALQPAGGAAAYGCAPPPHHALLTAWAGLNNDGDAVVVEAADGTELDRVAYPREAFANDGPSRRLDPAFRTPVGNDDFARWALSSGTATPCALPAPRPGTVQLAASGYRVSEGGGSVSIGVRRSGGTNGRVEVPYSTLDGSARAGADYGGASGTVVLAAGQEGARLDVPLGDDAVDEGDEGFEVMLGAPTGGAHLGEPSKASVLIVDDDPPATRPVLVPVPVVPVPGAPGGSSLGASPPSAGVTAPAERRPPSAAVAVAAWQRVLARGGVTVQVTCDRDCMVRADGRIALGGGRFLRLAGATQGLRAHVPKLLVLAVPPRRERALRRALHRRGTLPATVVATPAGGEAAERRTRVR
jgi:hypothetical protein